MEDLLFFLQHVGEDPARLIFEDELTRIYNRRFLKNYFEHKVNWDSLETEPVSLLMLDVDHFKQINDSHGHDIGDQALVWVAGLLTKVAGESGLAIRYAGDEFMILLPGIDRETAVKVGNALNVLSHESPPQLDPSDIELSITLSIGVASAPEDAQNSKDLVHKVDAALYFAKKSGRDCVADSQQVAPQEVFSKTALQQLDKAALSGREHQKQRVGEALKNFVGGENQFLIVEGLDGMGKSEFLKTIRLTEDENKMWQIEVKGNLQERFRPYYLTTNILIGLMNQQPDRTKEILDNLTPKEFAYLSTIFPQMGEPEAPIPDKGERSQREGLFATLVHFIPKLLDSNPLILLIDDLHFSDEATLLLIRRMLLRRDIPLFICGTSTPIQQDEVQREPAPLQRFFASHHEELNIVTVPLTPLTTTDIAQHFQQIFPQVSLPEKFEEHLAQVTQGNPLFIGEILRKLALDGKVINLPGNKSVIEPFEEDYLPRSLDEIVSEKIAVLDEESRQILDQASTFGENVSLSMLTGNSDIRESKVLEFIDQAVAQGLISSEYQSNDETIRFLSKRILNLTYGNIQEDRKQELHESIGTYKESLYNQKMLPSAASLAYHFRLSANEEKARLYSELTGAQDEQIFSSEEAVNYTGEELPEPSTTKLRVLYSLDRNVAAHVPEVISALLTALHEMELNPPGSQAVLSATSQLKQSIDTVLEDHPDLHLTHAQQSLEVNGERVDVSDYKPTAEAFVQLMSRLQLRGIGFFPDLTEQELTAMLEAIGGISSKEIDEDFWRRFTVEQDLLHLELKQTRISAIAGLDGDPELGTFQAKSQEHFVSVLSPSDGALVPGIPTLDDQDSPDSVGEKEPVEEAPLQPELEPEVIRQEAVPELKISPGLVKLTDEFLESASHKLSDLLLKGDEVEAGKIIDQFFLPFARQTVQLRTKVIHICGNLLKDPGLTSQPQVDLPPRTSPPSKLDPGPFEVHSKG